MELAIAPYRLKFIHPFGTAHGLRDGTDSVFVRLTRNGVHGFGEATLPPYLEHTQSIVIQQINSFYLKRFKASSSELMDPVGTDQLCPPARAALQMAYMDLINKEKDIHIGSSIPSKRRPADGPMCMVTIGHTTVDDIPLKLSQLPKSRILKVKLGALNDQNVLMAIKELDNRKLFLDANQGWTRVAQAEAAVEVIGCDRVIGLEQPFAKDRWDLHRELKETLDVPVYGDESIQGMADLERAGEAFDGVNLKLMKCGGLDVAQTMAERARELGLKVMLGSMSESTLGCGAMASLAPNADLLDLDGPWLVSNDPFQGLRMEQGTLVVDGTAGFGVDLRPGHQLQFNPIGA
jgi:L-alanine-DL-glutamate epimerase-like enolase superfamily enzyme